MLRRLRNKRLACRFAAKLFYIFSLRCADGSHYTGISCNIAERLKSTNDGRGPQAT